MKADIDKHGKLSIYPESTIEQFALKTWWTNYCEAPVPDGDSMLEVCFDDDEFINDV